MNSLLHDDIRFKVRPVGSLESFAYIIWDLSPFTIHHNTSGVVLTIGTQDYIVHQDSWDLCMFFSTHDVEGIIKNYLESLELNKTCGIVGKE